MAANWESNTVSGPAANAVIVDTGAMGTYGGRYFSAILNATLAGDFLLQHLDSGGGVLDEQELSIAANSATEIGPYTVVLDVSERVRIIMKAALTLGRVSCSLFWGDA